MARTRASRGWSTPRYNEKPALLCAYYTFWRDLDIEGMETVIRPDRGWGAIPTNDGLTVVVVGWPVAEAAAYKSDVEANYMATLEMAPDSLTASGGRRGSTLHGRPGAELLPAAVRTGLGARRGRRVHEGSDHGARHQQRVQRCGGGVGRDRRHAPRYTAVRRSTGRVPARRDAHAFPVYEFTTQMATLEPPPPELQQLLAAIEGNAPAMDQFVNLITGLNTAPEFFDPANIGRLLAPAPA